MGDATRMTKAFAGVRVLDFSQVLAGPSCTQHLAFSAPTSSRSRSRRRRSKPGHHGRQRHRPDRDVALLPVDERQQAFEGRQFDRRPVHRHDGRVRDRFGSVSPDGDWRGTARRCRHLRYRAGSDGADGQRVDQYRPSAGAAGERVTGVCANSGLLSGQRRRDPDRGPDGAASAGHLHRHQSPRIASRSTLRCDRGSPRQRRRYCATCSSSHLRQPMPRCGSSASLPPACRLHPSWNCRMR